MRTINEDLRVVKTKNAIQSAFLTLLCDKPLKDITVKEISESAQCNRNTFYLHYTDKYDLMEKLCVCHLEEMKNSLYATFNQNYSSTSDRYCDIAIGILNVIGSDLTFYKIVLGKNRYPDFADMYRKLMADFIYDGMAKKTESKYKNFEVEFSASGMVGFLKYWLANPEAYSKDEIAKEMSDFVVTVGTVIFK